MAANRALLDALRSWLVRDWELGGHVIVANEQLSQQVALFEDTDLQLRFTIAEPDEPGRFLTSA